LEFAILTNDQTGGSPILNYMLQWDAGSSGATWTDYSTLQESEGSEIILTTIYGLSSGETYQFKYRG